MLVLSVFLSPCFVAVQSNAKLETDAAMDDMQEGCHGAAGRCEEVRNSLLQVKSKIQWQPPVSEPKSRSHLVADQVPQEKAYEDLKALMLGFEAAVEGVRKEARSLVNYFHLASKPESPASELSNMGTHKATTNTDKQASPSLPALQEDRTEASFGTGQTHPEFPKPILWGVLGCSVVAVGCVMCCGTCAEREQDQERRTQPGSTGTMPGTMSLPGAASLPSSPSGSVLATQGALATGFDSSSSSRTPPQHQHMMSSSAAGPRQLCGGLVVPHGTVCVLAVPSLPSTKMALRDTASLDVQTLDGNSIIQAEVVMPNSDKAGRHPLVALCVPGLSSQQAPRVLAYCRASHDFPSQKSVCIYDSRNAFFAHVYEGSGIPRYVLTGDCDSMEFFFEGDLQRRAVKVRSGKGQVLAETTPVVSSSKGSHYRLRVVSNVDVGLVLCALFAIDCMEMS